MKTITIRPSPRYYLTMSLDEVKLLQEIAKNHYDMTCRQAGLPGGFINGWCNSLSSGMKEVTATFRDLDLVLKLLEVRILPAEKKIMAWAMEEHIRMAIRISGEKLRSIEYEVHPYTEEERLELLRKTPMIDSGDHFDDPTHLLEIYNIPKFGLKK